MRFLFHFGMPKAGSTSLQDATRRFAQIAYLLDSGQHYVRPSDYQKLFKIWNQDSIDEDYKLDPLHSDSLDNLFKRKSIKTCLVSCENAVILETPEKCCQRVLQLKLPNQEALFITRKPSDLVRSLYDMLPYDADGNWVSAIEFEEIVLTSNCPRYQRLRLWLDYPRSIQVHRDYFGHDKVHVFRFEDLFLGELSIQFIELASCLGVPARDLHRSIQDCKTNKASDHLASATARRILKNIHLSSFLPSPILLKSSLLLSRSLAVLHRKSTHEFAKIQDTFDRHYQDSQLDLA